MTEAKAKFSVYGNNINTVHKPDYMMMSRRSVIVGLGTAVVATGGCLSEESSTRLAHTVTVYHVDHEETTRNVTVTVENGEGDELFHEEYELSEENESDEDATFPASTEPETVIVDVDGARFERGWPGFEQQGLPCEGDNRAGIEIWIEGGAGEEPSIRMETNCQQVTLEEDETD